MCCNTMNNQKSFCSNSLNPMFLSKKKKLEILEHYSECLKEKQIDIEETIKELKEAK